MKKCKIILTIIVFILLILLKSKEIFATTSDNFTTLPLAPADFNAISAGHDSAKLSWGSVSGTSGYQIFRAISKTGTYKEIISTTSTTYKNVGLVTGKSYYYKVRAFNYVSKKKVYGNFSVVIGVKPIPSIPTKFIAVSSGSNAAKLSWGSTSGASGYQVFRATYKTDTYKEIKNTTSTTYTNSGLVAGKTYYYKIRTFKYVENIKIYSKYTTIVTVNIPVLETDTKVVGYYAAWAAYSGFYPDMVMTSKLTHINYAFANIGSNLKIMMGYPDIDSSNFTKLNALKKLYPHLKTIISVGGWSWSARFSDAALTNASRTTFADSCVDFIVKYKFDGVDIDWEYPVRGGMATNVNRPEDKVNFTFLMKKLREKLDARGEIDGKHYILTFAGASSNSYLNNTEMDKVQQYVDYVNVMTYDIHGMWDKYTDFNAPLYINSDISYQYKWSIDQSINSWLKAGVPAEKIVMGVPFYGYVYKEVVNTNHGLYQSYSGSSAISYENISKSYLNMPGYKRYYNIESMVPWLFNGSTFISYEDEQSIDLKADYIKSKRLGGAMIWELSQDPNGILLEALYSGLK